MIINKKNTIHRARPSGKTVCATLAAAGLISLAAAVTPAFAQAPPYIDLGANNITATGNYHGTNAGNVTVGNSYGLGGGYNEANINATLLNGANVGSLTFVDNHDPDADNNGIADAGATYDNYLYVSDLTVAGSITKNTTFGSKANLTVNQNGTLMVGGDIGNATIVNNLDNFAVNAGGTLRIGGNVYTTQALTFSDGGSLYMGAATTFANTVTVISDNSGKVTTIGAYDGANPITIGGTGRDIQMEVGVGDMQITTKGDITFADALTTAGNRISFTGDGNLFIGTATGGTGNITFAEGATLDNGITGGSITISGYSGISSGGTTNGLEVKAGTGAVIESAHGAIDVAGGDLRAEVTVSGQATIQAKDSISAAGSITAIAVGTDNNATINAVTGSITTGSDKQLTASATDTGKVSITSGATISVGKDTTDSDKGLNVTSVDGSVDIRAASDITVGGKTTIITSAANDSSPFAYSTLISSTTGGITFGTASTDDFSYTNSGNTSPATTGSLAITAKGDVTFNGAANTTFNGTAGFLGAVYVEAQNILYNNGLSHVGSDYTNHAVETGGKVEYKNAAVSIDAGEGNVSIKADVMIETDALGGGADAFKITQTGTGQAVIQANNGYVRFGADFTRTAVDGALAVLANGAIDDGSPDDGKAIVFAEKFSNETGATGQGQATISAQGGHIDFEKTAYHRGGRYMAQALSVNTNINHTDDLNLIMTVDGEGASITTAGGNIDFNSSNASTSGNGFTFTGAEDDTVGSDLNILAGYDVSSQTFTGDGGNITFGHNAGMTLQESGATNIVTSKGQIEMGVFGAGNTFNYTGEDGDLHIISMAANDDDRNVIINSDSNVNFTGGSGNTLIHAYEGNVFTFGDYAHLGGTGDRRVLALEDDGTGGYIREANFTATLGGGSLLWAATDKIDLNISKDGQTIGNYGPGMGFNFAGKDGGVSLVAGGAITVYNSLDYKGGGSTDGLKNSDFSDQVIILKGGLAGIGKAIQGTLSSSATLDEKLVQAKKMMAGLATNGATAAAIPKPIYDDLLLAINDPTDPSVSQAAKDFWNSAINNTVVDLGDRLALYLGDPVNVPLYTDYAKLEEKYGFYQFSREAIYYGKDLTLDLNGATGAGQAVYLQAPVVVTRGDTKFDTTLSTVAEGLTVYTDQWNIMGDLTINGDKDNLTVGSVTYDQTAARDKDGKVVLNANGNQVDANGRTLRGNPLLTLQGRIDIYEGAGADQHWAPNMFDASLDYDATKKSTTWIAGTPAHLDPDGQGLYINDEQITVSFNGTNGDPLNIFKNIRSAAATNSFKAANLNAANPGNAYLKADVLTSLGVESFQGNGTDLSGQIRMVSTGVIKRDTNGDIISIDPNTLESIGVDVNGSMEQARAAMYAARWNLGETTYEQGTISDSTLQKIFDETYKEVENLDTNTLNDIYGDDSFRISASQPGAHADHNGYFGLGTEGNASYTYIRDGLWMEDGVDPLGFWKFGGTDSGVISYQAMQSRLVFDQLNGMDLDRTHMNLAKVDFYGWMNVRDARTVMAAAMYNKAEHDEQKDQYVFDGQINYADGKIGYGDSKYGSIVWLQSEGGPLSDIDGLQNLPASAYNPFPDSPFFNLNIGYIPGSNNTQFGLLDFSRKMYSGSTPTTLYNQAPSSHAGMAWAIEANDVFGSLHVPANAYAYNYDPVSDPALASQYNQYNNQAVKWVDEGWANGGIGFETGKKVVANPDANLDPATWSGNASDYILADADHIKFVELNDYQFQHDNGYVYEYDRSHSVENILYLSPTRAQFNRDLTQISAGGNMDAVRMVNFQTMNNVFKMLAHRAAQRGWGLSASADCAPGSGLWGVADYSRTEVDGNFNRGYAGFDIDRYGATIGYDHQVIDEKLILGGYFSYSRPELDGWGRDIKADDIQFGLYAQLALPYDFIVNAGLAYGWQQYDLDRRVAIGRTFQNNLPIGFGETLSADYNGDSFQFNLEVAKYFYFDNGLYLRPSVQYDYNHVGIDSYREHSKNRWNLAGDPMNMIPSIGQSLSDTDFDQHIFRLGGTVGWINECKTFEAAAKAYWVHNGGDTEATGRARFNAVTGLGYNNPFDISGAAYDRNQFLYGVDLKFNPQDYDWSIVVGFEGLTGDKEDTYSGMAGFLYQF